MDASITPAPKPSKTSCARVLGRGGDQQGRDSQRSRQHREPYGGQAINRPVAGRQRRCPGRESLPQPRSTAAGPQDPWRPRIANQQPWADRNDEADLCVAAATPPWDQGAYFRLAELAPASAMKSACCLGLATWSGAQAVEGQGMFLQLEAMLLGDLALALLDARVDKFLDPAAAQAD